jgi:Ca2+-binding EF-hand superfamily protein
VRSKVTARGARGINGLRRVFKIMDDDGSKSLSRAEFIKAMQDYRITGDHDEASRIFNLFDRDHSNTIDYDEFLRAIVGEMNDRRQALIVQVFKKFDRNGDGVINIEDIKGLYNASHHPDVRSGRKTEEDVLYEFLDTFEQYYSLIVRFKLT